MAGVEDLVVEVVGVVVGVMFQQLYLSIKEARDQTKKFCPALAKLQDTITLIAPKIEELDRMNQQHHDNFSEDEIRVFIKLLEKGKELVITCLKIPRWNKIKKRKYAKRLAELDSSLCRLLNVEFQAEQSVHIKKMFSDMEKINKKLDCMNLHTS
ncbi:hypothetical protein EZV62_014073 [Acer yangbiense]|uniref:RPW8 domain-containing protein n=1 Tax=Acer yangbiense TaxID=1000413 RepID=A0A5C7HR55_9ROSI|nr:hypothetical protein EZV62_014073 [Acer yangbiense]